MSHAEQAAKRKNKSRNGIGSRRSVVTGGRRIRGSRRSSKPPMANAARANTLGEEQISDVRVATFYVFENENAGRHAPRLQLVKERCHTGTLEAAHARSMAAAPSMEVAGVMGVTGVAADPRVPEGPTACR
jgi:hypothetical protein